MKKKNEKVNLAVEIMQNADNVSLSLQKQTCRRKVIQLKRGEYSCHLLSLVNLSFFLVIECVILTLNIRESRSSGESKKRNETCYSLLCSCICYSMIASHALRRLCLQATQYAVHANNLITCRINRKIGQCLSNS